MAKCLNCGRNFKQKRYWQKFCSDKCRISYWQPISGYKMKKVLMNHFKLTEDKAEEIIREAKNG